MSRRSRTGSSLLATALVTAILAGCGLPAGGGRLDARPHGVAVAVPPRPDDTECTERIRTDHAAAAAIRAVMGVDGVEDTTAAAERAASDAAADTSRYGIPLTPAELTRVDDALGAVDGTIGLAGLVAAHPDILNALWQDNNTLTISVLHPDVAVLQLAQCLERGDFVGRVRYLSAGIPVAELSSLGDRIYSDRDALAREGIEVTVVNTDPRTETVRVGVAVLDDDTATRLIERYGTVVEVVETAGPQPLSPASDQPGGPGS